MKTQSRENNHNSNYNRWKNCQNLPIAIVSKPILSSREDMDDSKVQDNFHKITQSSSPLHTEHTFAELFLYRLVQCGQVSYTVSKPRVVQVAFR